MPRYFPDEVKKALQGHMLGAIDSTCMVTKEIPGQPDRDCDRQDLRDEADLAALEANLILHSRVMEDMRRRGDQQHHTLHAVAHCLSSSCVNAGRPLRWFPVGKWHRLSNHRFQQLLRVQLGVPPVMPLAAWECNCYPARTTSGRAVQARAGRVLASQGSDDGRGDDPTDDDDLAARYDVPMSEEPLHALMCPRRKGQATKRHDAVCKALAQSLTRLLPSVRATMEQRQRGTDQPQRRTDITVTLGSRTWELDVMITTPATRNKVQRHHTHERPGRAAEMAFDQKWRRYNGLHAQMQGELIPFVVETGGLIHPAAAAFVVDLAKQSIEEAASRAFGNSGDDVTTVVQERCRSIFNRVGEETCRSIAYMVAWHVEDMAALKQRKLLQHRWYH